MPVMPKRTKYRKIARGKRNRIKRHYCETRR